ncbi:hypothetical protein [Flavihumibacter sp. ZG627]|uniref:hypothetical protein n=1 Tax=Flavihumibacter sp. ZG627 TaxID=1463156 RepID=UPI00057F6E8A|nr:hypothetical protein [Flavihumibacter sp. ZG627]KIC89749.1 hypothetical protein HY58_15405 [Flavihumibacter sp. ZG627]
MDKKDDDKFPGYPHYPEKEDIYNKEEKIELDENGEPITSPVKAEDSLADDLDIPGSELDDRDEAIGEEDEENNYYSLGGDRHEDLEENDQ